MGTSAAIESAIPVRGERAVASRPTIAVSAVAALTAIVGLLATARSPRTGMALSIAASGRWPAGRLSRSVPPPR
ncbi:hypothetical protein MAHJHV54_47660 [Mycobacterium avium subsp. hominissuis]